MTPDYFPLTEKYRPRRFEDVVGQQSAIDTLRRHVDTGNNSAVIALGPSGTGKTSLMRIFSSAMNCEGPAPKPCGKCSTCELFEGPTISRALFHHYEFSGATHNDHATAKFTAELNRERFAGRYGIFIDEVHGLQNSAADALLKAVEHPAKGTFYMFATTEPDSVRPALRTRCVELELHPLNEVQSYGLLTRICEAEGFKWDRGALEMLVAAGRGSARDLVKLLDQTSQQGPLTVPLLTKALSLGWIAHLLDYFDALVRDELVKQEEALGRWLVPPARKAEAIRNFLVYLHNFEVLRRAQVIEPAFHQVTDAQRHGIIAALAPRAARRELDLDEYLLELAERWRLDPNTLRDATSLSIQVRRFHRTVNPPSFELDQQPASEFQLVLAGKKRPRFRSAKAFNMSRESTTGAKNYLSLDQVQTLVEAASMLPQEYGVLFNGHLHLDHTALGADGPKEIAELLSKLTHQLPARMRKWSDQSLHWVYLNSMKGSNICTEMIFHVPPAAQEGTEVWLKKVMGLWRGASADDTEKWSLDIDPVRATRERVRLHWRLLRQLLRGLDPDIEHWETRAKERRLPLIDLLRVPRQGRGPLGDVELRRFSTSASLGPEERRKCQNMGMTLLSAFSDCAWSNIDTGWELKEAHERRDERARREQQLRYLEARIRATNDVLDREQLQQEVAALERSWIVDPRLRRRKSNQWQWWQPSSPSVVTNT